MEEVQKEVQKAKDFALKLLSFRARSCYEIKSRLKEKGFDNQTIQSTLDFLLEYNFLDDFNFAQAWINNRTLLKPMGARRIRQELKQKGIAEDIIASVLDTLSYEQELELAKELVLKKTARGPLKRSKLEGFLARRGFSGQVIRRIIEDLPESILS